MEGGATAGDVRGGGASELGVTAKKASLRAKRRSAMAAPPRQGALSGALVEERSATNRSVSTVAMRPPPKRWLAKGDECVLHISERGGVAPLQRVEEVGKKAVPSADKQAQEPTCPCYASLDAT